MSIDKRAFSEEKLSAPEPLPYISRRALKRIPHPMPVPTVCSGCGGQVELVSNDEIYGRGYGDWPFAYLCRPCDAYVGLHPNTDIPLGTLANKALREERKRSKAVFHDLIRHKGGSRTHWYRELAKQMRIGVDQCHFGMFDLERCEQALNACRALFLQSGRRGATKKARDEP